LTEEFLAWAVRKQDGELATRLNQALDAIKKNGTLNNAKGKWIPVQVRVRK
jgi:ABC-type amino acid transport substrate-binding protein